ncbi:MAG: hypothetical protein QW688_07610 [Thermoprotei archaeon]
MGLFSQRTLSSIQLVVIGVAGAVGTGILFSSAAMTGLAGLEVCSPGFLEAYFILSLD